ncbi:MAG: flagellar biosynthesis protein FlhA [Chloroflexi bacterium]|nr:flagellar biosynthesis protein FlhA [Chloroflexota bacterium]
MRLGRYSDIALAFGVVTIVVMMIIPLPTALLDLLLVLNIATGLTVLVTVIYINRPLQFSVFPSLLLLVTLYRLALNVSTTRLILLQGDAGSVVAAFGAFVIGGNYVVGVVVFLILTIIQFVVITSGAGRVAEVAARFTLDAMPGKQMAIDADLSAGMITEQEARRRRSEIQREADFYGAMDGASKFVRGDAVAGVIILIINILGGFTIGVLQLGLPLQVALQRYTVLTVGDGLVAQIPALLISTGTGVLVTRAAAVEENLGRGLTREMLGNPRALMIVGAVLALLGVAPGMPALPFLSVGLLIAGLGYVLVRAPALPPEGAPPAVEPPKPPPGPLESVQDLLQVDPMELEIGYGLIPLVDAAQGGTLLNRITMVRRQLALELGMVLPTIRVRDNLQLKPNEYVIKLRGVEIARGEIMSNMFLAMNPGLAEEPVEGLPTTEPAFGLPAVWISPVQKERAESLGYTVVDPASVLTTHLTEVIKQYAAEILTRQDVQTLIDNVKRDYPAIVDDLLPNTLTIGEVQRVLQNLLRERVSVRDLVTILETLATYGKLTRDVDLLTEYVRRALARQICGQYKNPDNTLQVITTAPQLEQELLGAVQQTEQGTVLVLEQGRAQWLLQRVAHEMERVAVAGFQPVVLCSSRVRLPLRRFVERSLPTLVVLSFGEIAPGIEVRSTGLLDVE